MTEQDGRPVAPSLLTYRWSAWRVGTEWETVRYHDLRHTQATVALAGGFHPKIVSERLGHSSTREVLERYSHVLPDMQTPLVAYLDRVLGGG